MRTLGVMLRDVKVGGGVVTETVTTLVSAFAPLATITLYVPALPGAVKRPLELTVPPVAVYVRVGNAVLPLLHSAVVVN